MAKELKFVARLKDQVSQGMKRIGASMGRLNSAASSLAGSMGLALGGGALLGVGASMIRTMGNFEESMNKVRAVTKANDQEFKQLSATARQLGATTRFSASEAADGMGFLAMAGFKTNDIIGAMPGVLNLATAAQMDLAQASDIASNILTGYQMEVGELAHANDVLVTAMTNANVDLSMMGEAMKYAGPVASAAGVRFEEAAAAIALMGNAGIQGSMAGTALRGSISRMLSPSKEASKAMKKLGLQVKDANGKMNSMPNIVKQLQTAQAKLGNEAEFTGLLMEIFGERAGPAMAALVSQGSDALEKMIKDMENSQGATDEMARQMNEGLNAQLKALNSAWEEFSLTIGDTGVLNKATEGLTALTDALRGLTDLVKEGGFTGFLQAIVGTIIENGRAIVEFFIVDVPDAVINGVEKAFNFISGIFGEGTFGTEMTQGIRDAFEIIRGPILGFFDWLNNMVAGNDIAWTTLGQKILGVWNWIKVQLTELWGILKAVFTFEGTAERMQEDWDAIVSWLSDVWNTIVFMWQETIYGAITWDEIKQNWADAWNTIKTAWNTFLGEIASAWEDFSGFADWSDFISQAEEAWTDAKEIVSTSLSNIQTAVEEGLGALIGIAAGKMAEVIAAIMTSANSLKDKLGSAIQAAMDKVKSILNIAKDSIKRTADSMFDSIVSSAWRAAKKLVFGSIVPDMMKAMVDWFAWGYGEIEKDAWQFADVITAPWVKMRQKIIGLTKEFLDETLWAYDEVQNTIESRQDLLKFLLPTPEMPALVDVPEEKQRGKGPSAADLARRENQEIMKAYQERVRATNEMNRLLQQANQQNLTDLQTKVMNEELLFMEQQANLLEHAEVLGMQKEQTDLYMEMLEQAHQDRLALIREQALEDERSFWERQFQTTAEYQEFIAGLYWSFGQQITSIMANSMAAMLMGMQISNAQIDKAIGQMVGGLANQLGEYFIKEGLSFVAAGIARIAANIPGGGQLVAAGGKEVAAGLALKTLGSLASGSYTSLGGGGGGGGGGGPAPMAETGAGGGGGGGGFGGPEVPGRGTAAERYREGRVVIDIGGMRRSDIVTDLPGFIGTIVEGINEAAKRDIEITFVGDARS